MHLGIGTYTYPWLMASALSKGEPFTAIMRLLDKAIEHAISFVQIEDNVPLHILSEKEMDTIIEKASSDKKL